MKKTITESQLREIIKGSLNELFNRRCIATCKVTCKSRKDGSVFYRIIQVPIVAKLIAWEGDDDVTTQIKTYVKRYCKQAGWHAVYAKIIDVR